MELSLLLIAIGVILAIILIVKFIKKLVFTIISIFFVIILGVVAVAGLVYLDINQLQSQENFNVKLIIAEENTLLYGIQIPFENRQPVQEKVTGLSDEISSLDPKRLTKDDAEFDIIIEKDFFETLVKGKTISFNEILQNEAFKDYDLTFTGEEILVILDSSDPKGEFLNTIFNKVDLPDFLLEAAKPIAEEVIDSELSKQKLTLKEMLFSLTLVQVAKDSSETLSLIQGFKDEDIKVYPERLTFSLVRAIPAETIMEQINSFTSTEETIA
jgi:hypothetical protein